MKINKEFVISVVILLVVVGLGILLFKFGGGNPKPSTIPATGEAALIRDWSPMIGLKTAKVNVVEFADFQCPACGLNAPIIEQAIAAYKDNPNVNFVFRNFPLSQHPNAPAASLSAMAAGEQGKFWEMYTAIYSKQAEWSNLSDGQSFFISLANQLGLDMNKFQTDVQSTKLRDEVNSDIQDATSLEVTVTPTFFINDQKMPGMITAENLKAQIDSALK